MHSIEQRGWVLVVLSAVLVSLFAQCSSAMEFFPEREGDDDVGAYDRRGRAQYWRSEDSDRNHPVPDQQPGQDVWFQQDRSQWQRHQQIQNEYSERGLDLRNKQSWQQNQQNQQIRDTQQLLNSDDQRLNPQQNLNSDNRQFQNPQQNLNPNNQQSQNPQQNLNFEQQNLDSYDQQSHIPQQNLNSYSDHEQIPNPVPEHHQPQQNNSGSQFQNANLFPGFYDRTCPSAEYVVRSTMEDNFERNPLLAAGVVRLFFHDCFVRGCDGSVLLDRRPGGAIPEKESDVNNNSITGFRVIDEAKKKLEQICPGVVSCSDILALAARDAVCISGGPSWNVPTGRLDGKISRAEDADNEIPAPDLRTRDLKRSFLAKGLDVHDLVTLSGAHTIGRAHCPAFEDRLYNYSGTNQPDPSLNLQLLESLQKICPKDGNTTFTVSLDRQTQVVFDNTYYTELLSSNGLLQTDQQLLFDSSTSALVRAYAADSNLFFQEFARSMVKLSRLGVKAPGEGEIRMHCRRVNL